MLFRVPFQVLATLMRIVTVIGGRKATASSYVENILLRHFEQFQDEINTLYESHFHKPF